jgi:hypothetical protein
MITNESSMDLTKLNLRFEYLKSALSTALLSPKLSFDEIIHIEKPGIYIISNRAGEFLYVGKTARAGKIRMKELAAHFLSHSFNNKLMLEELLNMNYVVNRLTRKWRIELIETNKIPLDIFASVRKVIRNKVRTEFQFQFYEKESFTLGLYEHFFISVLAPHYND